MVGALVILLLAPGLLLLIATVAYLCFGRATDEKGKDKEEHTPV
jgi:hypothetical protein